VLAVLLVGPLLVAIMVQLLMLSVQVRLQLPLVAHRLPLLLLLSLQELLRSSPDLCIPPRCSYC
jgi:hypothetical protein